MPPARYRYPPLLLSYGCELEALVGQPYRADTRLSEAVRYVREALTVCPYITGPRLRWWASTAPLCGCG